MPLTAPQNAIIKAWVEADPILNALPNTNVGNDQIASVLNAVASPEFVVWRTSVPFAEVFDRLVDTDWQQFDNLTAGQERIWDNLRSTGSFRPATSAHRAAITECWKGTAQKVLVRDNLLTIGKRPALLVEKLLATGTGSTASPATMGREGIIVPDDIETARAS
jgi:hypothetical protein